MASQKKELTDSVVKEWDVSRRTAEFFDQSLGRLREVGIAASVAITSVAVQFQPAIGILLLPINFIFPVFDRRYQRYLEAASSYARYIEMNYDFAGVGLTESIRQRIKGKTHSFTQFYVNAIYVGFVILGIWFLTRSVNFALPAI